MSEAMKKEFKCLIFFNITGELFDAHVNYFNEEKELNEAMKARRKAMSVVESAINKVRKLRRDL
ncbi:hypothetical protein BZG72_13540 [Salinivibrio sp. PR6]|nr:hypothetical protein BZG72_13540 [Salinivibrio sp. PR6]